MKYIPEISMDELRQMLSFGEAVNIIDIRPLPERKEWFIPGSMHVDAYDRLKQNDRSVFDEIPFDAGIPVVTVCAGGKLSQVAADILRQKGLNAYSLKNGMKGWSLAWNTARLLYPGFEITQFRRTGKGCLSYLISSNGEAIVVDASLPPEVYLEVLQRENLVLKYVIETHIHADHLSRSRQLAEKSRAKLYLPASAKLNFDHTQVTGKTRLQTGSIGIKAIQTPGHTLESVSYLVDDHIILTGDTLFTEGIGRPDLNANETEIIQKSKKLYHSLLNLLALGDHIIVLPSHTSRPVDFDNIPIRATIGEIKHHVSLLTLNEEDFVSQIQQRIPPAPANYQAIAENNFSGNTMIADITELEAGANRCALS